VTAKLRTMVDVLMGEEKLAKALRQGSVVVEGERELARRFETLFEFDGSESFTGGTRQEAEVGRRAPAAQA
jgi:ubiquinone biosynthesis protein UbiJ